MGVSIEKPTSEDVRDIQELYYRTWLATYPNEKAGISRADIEDHFKNAFSPETIAKRTERIVRPPEGETSLVARDQGKVIGLIRSTVFADHNQINVFYVLPEYQGKGIGHALWDEIEKSLDSEKETRVHVFEYNERAIDFYRKRGFKDTGERFTRPERFTFKSGAIMPESSMIRKPTQ